MKHDVSREERKHHQRCRNRKGGNAPSIPNNNDAGDGNGRQISVLAARGEACEDAREDEPSWRFAFFQGSNQGEDCDELKGTGSDVDTGGYHVHSNHRRAQKEQCPEKSGTRREVPPFKGDKGGQEKNRGPAMQDFRSDFVADGERETPHEVSGHDEAGVSEIRRIVNAMRDEVKVRNGKMVVEGVVENFGAEVAGKEDGAGYDQQYPHACL